MSGQIFRIQRAEAGAAAPVQALDREIFVTGCWTLQQWYGEFASHALVLLLLGNSGQLCGFLSSAIAGDDLDIRKIGVLPAYRRQGLARKLLQGALAELRGKVQRCLIEVSAANPGGIEFYRRMGFSEMGRRSNYYADGSAALLMEKILSAP